MTTAKKAQTADPTDNIEVLPPPTVTAKMPEKPAKEKPPAREPQPKRNGVTLPDDSNPSSLRWSALDDEAKKTGIVPSRVEGIAAITGMGEATVKGILIANRDYDNWRTYNGFKRSRS